jgi:hypothetical protein
MLIFIFFILFCTGMTLFIIIKAIFLLQVFNCATGDVTCLASNCICKTLSAVCTGNNLTYIPRFPQNIRNVTIKNANLSRISENGFLNLTFFMLSNTSITVATSNACSFEICNLTICVTLRKTLG